MSTPTDPYSRPDHEDGNDDILDPLPEPRDEQTPPVSDGQPEPPAPDPQPERPSDESLEAPEPVISDDLRKAPAVDNLAGEESETESTRSWTPNFDDDDVEVAPESDSVADSAKPEESESARWEREFGSVNPEAEPTVIKESQSDDATVVTPVPAAASTGSIPTRTSVFNRGSADTAIGEPAAVTTPPDATFASVEPSRHRFDHQFEEPIPEEPRGRGWAHAGVFFATLILAPFAWYLVADSGVRLTGLENSAWVTGTVDWLVVLELLGALLCLGVLWYLASFSSVGAIVFGTILAVAGAVAIFAPAFAQDLLQSSTLQEFASFNDFTGNVAHHLTQDLATGRLTVYGFLLLMTGVVSHSARRQGTERGEINGRRGVLLSRNSAS